MTLSEEEKSELCLTCGDCCQFMVFDLNKPDPWPEEQRWVEWFEARGGVISPYTLEDTHVVIRINYPCPKLVSKIVDGQITFRCGIQDHKPIACKDFQGDKNTRKDGLRCAWSNRE